MTKPLVTILLFILFVGCNNNHSTDNMLCTNAPTDIKIFPGAQGFGTNTPAGRGGKIVKVTNLNDDGKGSLRAAIAQNEPKIVVFEVGGVITLTQKIYIKSPYITIAGQTAPDPGIIITGGGIDVSTHDVLIQHLTIRPGEESDDYDDGIAVNSANGWNVVLDHLSLQWAKDEQISTWVGAHDITVSHCLIAEGLREQHGMLIGDSVHNVFVYGNVFAHNGDRQPAQKGDSLAIVANNVSYNPGGWMHYYFSDNGLNDSDDDGYSGPLFSAVVGNVYIDGSSSQKINTAIGVAKVHPESQVYLANNVRIFGKVFTDTDPPVASLNSAIDLSLYVFERNTERVKYMIPYQAGSRPARRNEVDSRILTDLKNGTGTVPLSQPRQPSYEETYRTFEVPLNPNSDDDCDGYTNLEELLHQMAEDVESPPAPLNGR